MLDDAKKFLARAVPWPTGESDRWWINIHHTWTPPNADRAVLPGRAFKRLDDALAHIEWLLRGQPTDIYVCMSGQAQIKPGINSAQRSIEYSTAFQGIWIDADVKPGGYPNTLAVLDGLDKFCDATGMEMPTLIVLTGSGGLHGHWTFDRPVDAATWQPLAHALRNACIATGFTVDGNVTVDAARVLRIPNTHNWKGGIGREVKLVHSGSAYPVQRIASTLARFFSPLGTVPGRTGVGSQSGRSFAWLPTVPIRGAIKPDPRWTNVGATWKPSLSDILRGACEWIRHVARTHGRDQTEPLWREALTLAYYTEEGRDAIHVLSDRHPGYNHTATEVKYNEVEKAHGGGKYGWPQCRTIHGMGADQCATCPLLARGKSPLNFTRSDDPAPPLTVAGKAAVPPPIQMPGGGKPLPKGWYRDADGLVYTQKPGDDGDAPVNQYAALMPIWNLDAQEPKGDDKSGWLISFTTQSANKPRDVSFAFRTLADDRAISAALFDYGFSLISPYTKTFRTLMASFIESLRNQTIQSSENLGWTSDGGTESGFVYAKTKWNCTGNTPVVHSDPLLAEMYQPTGQMDLWRKASALVFDRHRPDLEAILSVAFAAPLVMLTGHSGLIVSAHSNKSGVGKTTALTVGAATWGDPSRTMAGIETPNYLNKYLAMVRHLPIFYDEMRTQGDNSKMGDLLFAVGLGRVKGRLDRASKILPVDNYSTILMAASNNSIVDYISGQTKTTPAGVMRIFEFEAERPDNGPLIDVGDAQMILGRLNRNYGMAGLEYAKYLGQNFDAIRSEIASYNSKFTTTLHATQEERFWVGAMVTMRLGAKIANSLGLTKFDERGLTEFLATEFERMRKSRAKSGTDIGLIDTLKEYVTDYLNDRQINTVHTDVMRRSPGGHVQLKTPLVRAAIRVHIADDDRLLRLSIKDFREWLKAQNVSERRAIIDGIVKVGLATELRSPTPLGMGFKEAGARERVLEFDLAKHPDLLE